MNQGNPPASGSGAGRAAPRSGPGHAPTDTQQPTGRATHVNEVRSRIAAGFYDAPAVVREVAARILATGLLDS